MTYLTNLRELYARHKSAFILGTCLSVGLLIIGILEESLEKTITYLAVMLGCFLLSEFIYFTSKPVFEERPIHKPRQELMVIIAIELIASAVLVSWFILVDQTQVDPAIRIILMTLRIIFILPVFILIYFLAIRKYSLRQIGIWSFRYWFVSLPIILLMGAATYFSFPEDMQFEAALQQNGILGFVTLGFLMAAIPEEITRNLFQTRFGAVLNNKGIAWFIVSFIWAIKHIPLFAFQSDWNYYDATISALGILPIGLLWGYLNQRYHSIIPSVIIHGTNLWGLQNIF